MAIFNQFLPIFLFCVIRFSFIHNEFIAKSDDFFVFKIDAYTIFGKSDSKLHD